MKARRGKFRFAALIVLLAAFCLFIVSGLALLAITWNFDYFGWHSRARWLVHASEYKSKVMSEPLEQNVSLRHLEQDGWGFPGAGDTVLYLVFDPKDDLLDASNTRRPGKYAGIPCEVVRVRRLEKDWYIVRFYTDTDWNNCLQPNVGRKTGNSEVTPKEGVSFLVD